MKKLILAAAVVVAVSGCSTTGPQYYYGQYNDAVYSYFKADDVTVEEQVSVLMEIIEVADAKSKPVAPGIHAHLGMLFFETGNGQMGVQHFEQEKALFPESRQYIDFLMQTAKEAQNASR